MKRQLQYLLTVVDLAAVMLQDRYASQVFIVQHVSHSWNPTNESDMP